MVQNKRLDAPLNAYPKALSELNEDQKTNIILVAQKELAKLFGIQVAPSEIANALADGQKFSDEFANSEAFKQTEATVAIKKQLQADAQQALETAKTA